MGTGHDIDFEVKVFEWLFVTDIEQVATVAMGNQCAVLNRPRFRMFLGFFPAIEGFAVEKLDEAFFGFGSEKGLRWRKEGTGGEGKKEVQFHCAENKRTNQARKSKCSRANLLQLLPRVT